MVTENPISSRGRFILIMNGYIPNRNPVRPVLFVKNFQ